MIRTVTFPPRRFYGKARYKCVCGQRFQRVKRDYWTANPFNVLLKEQGEEACNERCRKAIDAYLATQPCPKCDMPCAGTRV